MYETIRNADFGIVLFVQNQELALTQNTWKKSPFFL